jgi:hypothetical protein
MKPEFHFVDRCIRLIVNELAELCLARNIHETHTASRYGRPSLRAVGYMSQKPGVLGRK